MRAAGDRRKFDSGKKYLLSSDPDSVRRADTSTLFNLGSDQSPLCVGALEQDARLIDMNLRNLENLNSSYPLQPCPFTFLSAVRQKLPSMDELQRAQDTCRSMSAKRLVSGGASLTAGWKGPDCVAVEEMNFVMPLKIPDLKICPKTLDRSCRDNATSMECSAAQADRVSERAVKAAKSSERVQVQRKLDFSSSDQQSLISCVGADALRGPNASIVHGTSKKKEHTREPSREKENRYKRLKRDDVLGARVEDGQRDVCRRSRSPRHLFRKEIADGTFATPAGKARHDQVPVHNPQRDIDFALGRARGRTFATSTVRKDADKKRKGCCSQFSSAGEPSAKPTTLLESNDDSEDRVPSDPDQKRKNDSLVLRLLGDPSRVCVTERRQAKCQSKHFVRCDEERLGGTSRRDQVKRVADRSKNPVAEYEAERYRQSNVAGNTGDVFDANLSVTNPSFGISATSHSTRSDVQEMRSRRLQGESLRDSGDSVKCESGTGDDCTSREGRSHPSCVAPECSAINGDSRESNDASLAEALLDPRKISFRDVAYKPEEFATLLTPDVNLMFRAKRRKQITDRREPEIDVAGPLRETCVTETTPREEDARLLHPTALHMQFQAELHLLDSFDESLRHVMNVEKSLCDVKQREREDVRCKQDLPNDVAAECLMVTRDCSAKEKGWWRTMDVATDENVANVQRHGERDDGRSLQTETRTCAELDRNSVAVLAESCRPSVRMAEVQTQTVNDIGTQTDARTGKPILPRKFEEIRGITYRRGSSADGETRQFSLESVDQYEEDLEQIEEISLPSKMRTMSEISLHETTSSIKTETGTEISISTRDLTCSFNRYLDLEIAQLIKDEKQRYDKIEMLFKSREKTLHDRTKKLVKLEEQKRALRDTGQDSRISSVKKKQRALLLKLQQEKDEMSRLKELHKIASQERKLMLQKQRNMFNPQMSTKNILTKLKRSADNQSPRRLSGPMKGYDIRSNSSMSSLVDSDKSQHDRSQHETNVFEGSSPRSDRTKSDGKSIGKNRDAVVREYVHSSSVDGEIRERYASTPPTEGDEVAKYESRSRKFEEIMPKADALKSSSRRYDVDSTGPRAESSGLDRRRGEDPPDGLHPPVASANEITCDSLMSESEARVNESARRSRSPHELHGRSRVGTMPRDLLKGNDPTSEQTNARLAQEGSSKRSRSLECTSELRQYVGQRGGARFDKLLPFERELLEKRTQQGYDHKAGCKRKVYRCQKAKAALDDSVDSSLKTRASSLVTGETVKNCGKRTKAEKEFSRSASYEDDPSLNDFDLGESQSSLRALLMHSSAVQQRNSKLLRDIAYDRVSAKGLLRSSAPGKDPESREDTRPTVSNRADDCAASERSAEDGERGISKSIVIRERLADYENTEKLKEVLGAREAALVSRKNCVEEWMAWHARLSEEENRVAKMEEAALKLAGATSDIFAYQDTTLSSDTSDVEGRIELLAEKLAERRVEMSRLKKEARKRAKQRLRALEANLLNQIKRYDTTIHEMRKKLEARRGRGKDIDKLAIECKSLAEFKVPDIPLKKIQDIYGCGDLPRSKSESDLLLASARRKDVALSSAHYTPDFQESDASSTATVSELCVRSIRERTTPSKDSEVTETVITREPSAGTHVPPGERARAADVDEKRSTEEGRLVITAPTTTEADACSNSVSERQRTRLESSVSIVSVGATAESDGGALSTESCENIAARTLDVVSSQSGNGTPEILRERPPDRLSAATEAGDGGMRMLSKRLDVLQLNNKYLNEDIASLENDLKVLSKMMSRFGRSTSDGIDPEMDRVTENGTSKAISGASFEIDTIGTIVSEDSAGDARTAEVAVAGKADRISVSPQCSADGAGECDTNEVSDDASSATSEDMCSPASNSYVDYKARSKEILNEIEKSIMSPGQATPERDVATTASARITCAVYEESTFDSSLRDIDTGQTSEETLQTATNQSSAERTAEYDSERTMEVPSNVPLEDALSVAEPWTSVINNSSLHEAKRSREELIGDIERSLRNRSEQVGKRVEPLRCERNVEDDAQLREARVAERIYIGEHNPSIDRKETAGIGGKRELSIASGEVDDSCGKTVRTEGSSAEAHDLSSSSSPIASTNEKSRISSAPCENGGNTSIIAWGMVEISPTAFTVVGDARQIDEIGNAEDAITDDETCATPASETPLLENGAENGTEDVSCLQISMPDEKTCPASVIASVSDTGMHMSLSEADVQLVENRRHCIDERLEPVTSTEVRRMSTAGRSTVDDITAGSVSPEVVGIANEVVETRSVTNATCPVENDCAHARADELTLKIPEPYRTSDADLLTEVEAYGVDEDKRRASAVWTADGIQVESARVPMIARQESINIDETAIIAVDVAVGVVKSTASLSDASLVKEDVRELLATKHDAEGLSVILKEPVYEDISEASLEVSETLDGNDSHRAVDPQGSLPEKYQAMQRSDEVLRMLDEMTRKSSLGEVECAERSKMSTEVSQDLQLLPPNGTHAEVSLEVEQRNDEASLDGISAPIPSPTVTTTAPMTGDRSNSCSEGSEMSDGSECSEGSEGSSPGSAVTAGQLSAHVFPEPHARASLQPNEREGQDVLKGLTRGSDPPITNDGGDARGDATLEIVVESPRDLGDCRLDVETLDDDLLSEENAEGENVDVKADTSERDIEIMIGKLKASLEQPGLEVAEFEAKLLRIKQLEIELEIKKLEAEEVSYYVREIPNKPPPPYTPPGGDRLPAGIESVSPPAATVVPTNVDDLTAFTERVTLIIYRAKQAGTDITEMDVPTEIYNEPMYGKHGGSETTRRNRKIYDTFLFDLCKEIIVEIYRSEFEEPGPSWTKPNVKTKPAIKIPRTFEELNEHVAKEVATLFGFKTKLQRENMVMRWSRKRRDRVDELLAREAQAEEDEWTKFHYDELAVKNGLTVAILDSLITETTNIVNMACAKKRRTMV